MRRMLFASLLLGGALLAGCATLSEEQCLSADWGRIGSVDGTRGRTAGFLANHARACEAVGVTPDRAAWEAGRQQGLRLYCTPERAYAEGRDGSLLSPVCPAELTPQLRAANRRGLDYHDALQTIGAIESDLAYIGRRLARSDDPAERADLRGARAVLLSELLSARLDLLTAGRF